MRVFLLALLAMTACVHTQNAAKAPPSAEETRCTDRLSEGEFVFDRSVAGTLCRCVMDGESEDQQQTKNLVQSCFEQTFQVLGQSEEFLERLRFHTSCTNQFSGDFQTDEQAFVFCACIGKDVFVRTLHGKPAETNTVTVSVDSKTWSKCYFHAMGDEINIAH